MSASVSSGERFLVPGDLSCCHTVLHVIMSYSVRRTHDNTIKYRSQATSQDPGMNNCSKLKKVTPWAPIKAKKGVITISKEGTLFCPQILMSAFPRSLPTSHLLVVSAQWPGCSVSANIPLRAPWSDVSVGKKHCFDEFLPHTETCGLESVVKMSWSIY